MSPIKFYRLIGMMLVLESKKQITAKELSERFEVSVRTIYRDLEILSQAGIPIVTESGPGGGVSLVEGYRFNMNALDQRELSSMIKTFADQELFVQTDDISRSMLLKVRHALPTEVQVEFDRFMNSMKIDTTTWFGAEVVSTENKQLLDTIKQSILEKAKLKFDYKSYQSSSRDRIVHPYGLVKKAKAWYLVGFCEMRLEVRVFNLVRIQNMSREESTFECPNDFDLNLFWEKTICSFQEKTLNKRIEPQDRGLPTQPKYPVTLKLEEKSIALLEGFTVLSKEKKGDMIHLTVDLINDHIAIQQLFMNLDQIVLLQPDDLRESILNKIRKISEIQSC